MGFGGIRKGKGFVTSFRNKWHEDVFFFSFLLPSPDPGPIPSGRYQPHGQTKQATRMAKLIPPLHHVHWCMGRGLLHT